MKKTIAQNMADLMKKKKVRIVWLGDPDLVGECAKISNMKKDHPLKLIYRVLNALDKSPLFSKGYIYSDHEGRNIKYRSFKLLNNETIEKRCE
ncbi:hypothetical protein KHQ81_15655 (plasmid) [Mycoplasmatota bacterium]|nr:hypothetical protein KHQ81_15655 [Mycoplasmatota bacterium]